MNIIKIIFYIAAVAILLPIGCGALLVSNSDETTMNYKKCELNNGVKTGYSKTIKYTKEEVNGKHLNKTVTQSCK